MIASRTFQRRFHKKFLWGKDRSFLSFLRSARTSLRRKKKMFQVLETEALKPETEPRPSVRPGGDASSLSPPERVGTPRPGDRGYKLKMWHFQNGTFVGCEDGWLTFRKNDRNLRRLLSVRPLKTVVAILVRNRAPNPQP